MQTLHRESWANVSKGRPSCCEATVATVRDKSLRNYKIKLTLFKQKQKAEMALNLQTLEKHKGNLRTWHETNNALLRWKWKETELIEQR